MARNPTLNRTSRQLADGSLPHSHPGLSLIQAAHKMVAEGTEEKKKKKEPQATPTLLSKQYTEVP